MFTSVMKDDATAAKLINGSPLKYDILIPRSTTDTLLADLSKSKVFDKTRPSAIIRGGQDVGASGSIIEPEAQTTERKEFSLQIYPSPEYRHEYAMTSSLLHKSWPPFYDEDPPLMTRTLQQSLPDSIAAKGLSHWDLDLIRRRVPHARKATIGDRLRLKSWLPSKMKSRPNPSASSGGS